MQRIDSVTVSQCLYILTHKPFKNQKKKKIWKREKKKSCKNQSTETQKLRERRTKTGQTDPVQ